MIIQSVNVKLATEASLEKANEVLLADEFSDTCAKEYHTLYSVIYSPSAIGNP